jgi:hypothetical protein
VPPASGAPASAGSEPASATAPWAAPSSAPTPSPAIGRVVAPPPRDHRRAHPAAHVGDAHLSITCDVAADAFVDGELVRATPIVDLPLAPGRHVVRVESTAPGLRLIPREETIELRPGELRQLQMDLK